MLRTVTFLLTVGLVLAAAAVTGSVEVYFFLYLGLVILGLAYLLARRGLTSLEAGSWLDRQHATVGDALTVTYTLRSSARLPKPWLETHSPSTLPVPIPGRVISLRPRTSRTWASKVPLTHRGQYRVDPMVVRTGDPFGLFESVASVGPGSAVLVYPQVHSLPGWHLPAAAIEGASARAEHGPHLTPLVTSVRPYTPGDAFNRIHWRSSARHQELQVKEFDIEPSADLWIWLDLDRSAHAGSGEHATIETAVDAAAAIAAHALSDDRGVGLEAVGLRRAVIATDRGARQQHKVLSLLAVAQPEGTTPLAEMLVEGGARMRTGTVALVVTPSLDRSWVAPLAALRSAGASPIACIVDPTAHSSASLEAGGQPGLSPSEREPLEQQLRSLVHLLAEHDVRAHLLRPGIALGEQLVTSRDGAPAVLS
ncbi:MAG: DUF58 domain-containing protein [Chloroflexota bacterium]|jgi:uncharacterized protein (DUF58 family)